MRICFLQPWDLRDLHQYPIIIVGCVADGGEATFSAGTSLAERRRIPPSATLFAIKTDYMHGHGRVPNLHRGP